MVEIHPNPMHYGCQIRIFATKDYSRVFVTSDEWSEPFHEADSVESEALAERFGVDQRCLLSLSGNTDVTHPWP